MSGYFQVSSVKRGRAVPLTLNAGEVVTIREGIVTTIQFVGTSTSFSLDAPVASVRVLRSINNVVDLELVGVQAGAATLRSTSRGEVASVRVHVGTHRSHFSAVSSPSPWVVDLLADRSNRGDLWATVAIQRILQNAKGHDNVIDQRRGLFGSTNTFNCGDVCLAAAKALFGRGASAVYRPYHRAVKAKPNQGSSSIEPEYIVYDEDEMGAAKQRILELLNAGTAVRVGTMYEPYWTMLANGFLQSDRNGGHSVLIVASDGLDQFLYLDPLPGFSSLDYRGGLPFNAGQFPCSYMGVFRMVTEVKRGSIMRNEANHMEVVSGP